MRTAELKKNLEEAVASYNSATGATTEIWSKIIMTLASEMVQRGLNPQPILNRISR